MTCGVRKSYKYASFGINNHQFQLQPLRSIPSKQNNQQNVQDCKNSFEQQLAADIKAFLVLFIQIIVLAFVAMACAAPEPKADPKAQILAYSAPLVSGVVPSAVYERSYHGNFAYPYAAAPVVSSAYVASPYVSAPVVAASPYAYSVFR